MSDDYSFSDIQGRAMVEVKEPRNPPNGTWELEVVSGKIKEGPGGNGPAAKALFRCRLIKAYDDVNEAQLMDFGDDGIAEASVFLEIPIFERRDEWNIIRFVGTTLGADITGIDGVIDCPKEAKGYHFIALLADRVNEKDMDHPFLDVTSPRPVE